MNPKNFLPLGIGALVVAAIIFAGQSGLLKQAGKLQKADVADVSTTDTTPNISLKTGANLITPDYSTKVSELTGCDIVLPVYQDNDNGPETEVTELQANQNYLITVKNDCIVNF